MVNDSTYPNENFQLWARTEEKSDLHFYVKFDGISDGDSDQSQIPKTLYIEPGPLSSRYITESLQGKR